MSTALAIAGRLKPEIRLGRAISEFQADLSTPQKKHFRAHQASAANGTSTPTLRDVMRVTAEINQESGLLGRCFGSRLTNILQAVQQFAALGDVVLGGTQNLLACGVWSLVRMTLLSVVTYSAYFERLSFMLMAVGRSAPRYQTMGAMFLKSGTLRSYMLEYYIVVVRLFHHVLQLSQKSGFSKWISTLADPRLESFQSDLEVWATSIKEEVHLLNAQQTSDEIARNNWFRSHFTQQAEELSHSKTLRARKRILDACSAYDHENSWKQTRKLGHTRLLNDSTIYAAWKEQSQSCTLVCTGKLGSGKSVLLANMVDDLSLATARETTIAYFFCQHDTSESLTARTVIGSLIRQLLYPATDLAYAWEVVHRTQVVGLDGLLDILRHTIPGDRRAYFILDGLGHCDAEERELILATLGKVQGIISLSLCISFRSEPANMRPLALYDLLHITTFCIPEKNPDIDEYINEELQKCIKTGRLTVRDPFLVLEIQNHLSRGAEGMFLWVVLQIKALCMEHTDADIRQAIAHLPRDLSGIYNIILEKSKAISTAYQTRILELVMTARRPLTTEEMREALSVKPGYTVWNPETLLNDVRATLACCGCLLAIDEETLNVQMIHHSAKAFLLDASGGHAHFDLESAYRRTAEIIVTFLNYGVFSKQVSKNKTPHIRAEALTSSVISSTMCSLGQPQKLALKLLRTRKGVDENIGHTLMDVLGGPSKIEFTTPLAFYGYATSWWQEHISHLDLGNKVMEKLLMDLLITVDPNTPDSQGRTLFSHALERGHVSMVKLLLERGARDVEIFRAHEADNPSAARILLESAAAQPNAEEGYRTLTSLLQVAILKSSPTVPARLVTLKIPFQDHRGQTSSGLAIVRDFEEDVHTLFKWHELGIEIRDDHGNTALHAAAECFDAGVIECFGFSRCNCATMYNEQQRTPLWVAAAKGNLPAVKAIVAIPDVRYHLGQGDEKNSTPLWIAAANGHDNVVPYLMSLGGVELNLQNIDGYTPLAIAAKNGHSAVVEALMCRREDLRLLDDVKLNPVWLAATSGHSVIVENLVKGFGTDSNTYNAGERLLSEATSQGKEEIVRILDSAFRALITSQNPTRQGPLRIAARNGHARIVKLLVRYPEVDVNIQDAWDKTPIGIAARKGHHRVVAVLAGLERTDVDTEDSDGETPLLDAIRNCQEEVVRVLARIERVDVNRVNRKDRLLRTPLLRCVWAGRLGLVRALMECGRVDPLIPDAKGRSPLVGAKELGFEDIVDYLRPLERASGVNRVWIP